MNKEKSLYGRGMKPYVKIGNGEWEQKGLNVRYLQNFSLSNEKKVFSLFFDF